MYLTMFLSSKQWPMQNSLVYVKILLIVAITTLTEAPCPWSGTCSCSSSSTSYQQAKQVDPKYTVNCTLRQLPAIPPSSGNPAALTYELIDFSHNNITSIQDGAFQELTTAQRIVRLSLTHNQISYIHRNAFAVLKYKLDYLLLDYNHLTTVPGEAVRNLAALSELHLSFNKINTFPAMTFQGNMESLEELKLQNNRLTSLPTNALQGLPNIFRVLDLRYNNIDTLNICTVADFPNLQYVKMDGNQLSCTCDLKWMIDREVKLQISAYTPVYCSQGKDNRALPESLQCGTPPNCGYSSKPATTTNQTTTTTTSVTVANDHNSAIENQDITVVIVVVAVVIGLVIIAVILAVVVICWMRHKQHTTANIGQGQMGTGGQGHDPLNGKGHQVSRPIPMANGTEHLEGEPGYEPPVPHDASHQHMYTQLRTLPPTPVNNETGEAQYEVMHPPDHPVYQNNYSYCDDVNAIAPQTQNAPEYLDLLQ